MAVDLRKSQTVRLSKGNYGLRKFFIGLGWDTNKYSGGFDFDLDVVVFLTDKNGTVKRNSDFIYYGNLVHSSGSVTHMGDNLTGEGEGDDEKIKVNTDMIPNDIERLIIAVTIYEADKRKQNFGQVDNACLRIFDEFTQREIIRYELDEDFSTATSVIIGAIYRCNGEWMFNAIGSGINGDLNTLCRSYGVNMHITDPRRGAVVLKKGRKINLSKETTAHGSIVINLDWSHPEKLRGYRGPNPNGIDLDLGCLYELTDNKRGFVQALGKKFGSETEPPYIKLSGDDTVGSVGETLIINGDKIHKIKRVLIYTFIYSGIANWREADGIVTIKCPGRRDIIVKMDEYGSTLRTCAIACLENVNGEALSLQKEVRFFNRHSDMDAAYNWGLRWVTGKK